MSLNKKLLFISTVLLIIVDFLAFHDLSEPHAIKDWLILVASVLVFIATANLFLKKLRGLVVEERINDLLI